MWWLKPIVGYASEISKNKKSIFRRKRIFLQCFLFLFFLFIRWIFCALLSSVWSRLCFNVVNMLSHLCHGANAKDECIRFQWPICVVSSIIAHRTVAKCAHRSIIFFFRSSLFSFLFASIHRLFKCMAIKWNGVTWETKKTKLTEENYIHT